MEAAMCVQDLLELAATKRGNIVKISSLPIFGVPAIVIVSALYVAPAATRQKITMPLRALVGNSTAQCFEAVKDHLKDPDSAYLVNTTPIDDRTFRLHIRSKNGMGGYDGVTAKCFNDSDASMNDSFATLSLKQED